MIERLIWVVPAAVLAAGLWRPRTGLIVLAASLPLFGSPPGGPYLGALDAAGLAAILTAYRRPATAPSALTAPALAFLALGLLSLVPLPYLPPSWQPGVLLDLVRVLPGVATSTALYSWRAGADLLLGFGLFLAVRRTFAGHSLKPLAVAFLAGLTATLALGLASMVGGLDLDGYRPLIAVRPVLRRLQSLFFLSGWLSEYLVLAAPLAILAAAAWRRGRAWVLPPLVGLVVTGLALTQQRGAWVAAAASVAVLGAFILYQRRDGKELRRVALAAIAGLGIALAVLAGTGSLGRLADRSRSVRSGLEPRLELWQPAVEMIRSRPLFGWGLGSFNTAYDVLHPPGSDGARQHRGSAHSLYLQLASERGLLGLLAFAWLIWVVIACLRSPQPGEATTALALGATLAAFLAYGLVQYMFHLRAIAWLFWLLVGAVAVVTRHEPTRAFGRRPLFAAALLAALVLARALVVEAPAYAGNRSFGLHEREGEHRWTRDRAAVRLPWTGETLLLELANGHPLGAERPVQVAVEVNGRRAADLVVQGGWQKHRIVVGPPTSDWFVLALEVRPSFRPFSDYHRIGYRRSRDIRELGVAFKEPRWLTVDDATRDDATE